MKITIFGRLKIKIDTKQRSTKPKSLRKRRQQNGGHWYESAGRNTKIEAKSQIDWVFCKIKCSHCKSFFALCILYVQLLFDQFKSGRAKLSLIGNHDYQWGRALLICSDIDQTKFIEEILEENSRYQLN